MLFQFERDIDIPRYRSMNHVIILLTRIFSGSIGLTASILYLLRFWFEDHWWVLRLFNIVLPWLWISLFLLIGVVNLFRIGRGHLFALMVPFVLIGSHYAGFFMPPPYHRSIVDQDRITVMTYSVCTANDEVTEIVKVISMVMPDILLIQEVKPEIVDQFYRQVAALYSPHVNFIYDANIRLGVLSRFPLVEVLNSPNEGRVLKVRADTHLGWLEVWNVHASHPFHWEQNDGEIESLVRSSLKVDGPLIVGGDFNKPDSSESYHQITRYLGDAHREMGWGFGFTYPAPNLIYECRTFNGMPPLPVSFARIDYLFHNGDLLVKHVKTLDQSGGSDHLPVVAEFTTSHR